MNQETIDAIALTNEATMQQIWFAIDMAALSEDDEEEIK